MARSKNKKEKTDPWAQSRAEGIECAKGHPLLCFLAQGVYVYQSEERVPRGAWARVTSNGAIWLNSRVQGSVGEWQYVVAACLLHLGFENFKRNNRDPVLWQRACDAAVGRFLLDTKIGVAPVGLLYPVEIRGRGVEEYYQWFLAQGVPKELSHLGVGGDETLIFEPEVVRQTWRSIRQGGWKEAFGQGIDYALENALEGASGREIGNRYGWNPNGEEAKQWFLASYPLLAGLAAGFRVVEDIAICQRWGIQVAAVDPSTREIYVNPLARLSSEEMRFVMAHEMLHVALRHVERCGDRDFFLYNCSADYVINGWLASMGVGRMPQGLLYDAELGNESADSIYDRLASDLRRARKLKSFKAAGEGDILRNRPSEWWEQGGGVSIDEFCKRALVQGMAMHDAAGRGLLPAGLVEEIRAMEMPPVAWDVQLARWFESTMPSREKRRTYARPSRRQGSTPDIPRPALERLRIEDHTFGVVLDTSGSMDTKLLAKALGTIVGYAGMHDVSHVRLVCCDAHAYDLGYVAVESMADKIEVKGRGGTVLQPGIDLLETAGNFPEDAPILVITDGYCDIFQSRRSLGIVLPKHHKLPGHIRADVFEID